MRKTPQRARLPFEAILAAGLVTLSGCGSSPPKSEDSNAPSWTHQSARSVDGGYIIYVGTGEDRLLENARTKAEGVAFADLANECSFAPKGARVEDRYEREKGLLHVAYVKVAVDFSSCEEAKGAVQPDEIRKLGNVQIAREIDRYHDLVTEEQEEADETGAVISPETQAMLSQTQTPVSSTSTGPTGVRWVVVQNEPSFWIVRQQVAYAKEEVILAPPTQYPPGSPQTRQFVNQLSGPVQQVRTFEQAHPALRSSSTSWSGVQREESAKIARQQALGRPGHRNASPGRPKPSGNQNRKARKRRWER